MKLLKFKKNKNMDVKFVVTCNGSIQAVILDCDNKEEAFDKFLVSGGIDKDRVKNVFTNEYEPYFIGFEYENEDYSLDGFYYKIFYLHLCINLNI